MFNSYSASQGIVSDTKTEVLVKPFELKTFAYKTLKLARDHKRLNELSANGLIHCKNFSYCKVYKKWELLLNLLFFCDLLNRIFVSMKRE
jgi:hypothetical protein